VTSRAAVVYAHKNETIDVITSKKMKIIFLFPPAGADQGTLKYGDQVYDILAY
jgi:hypothetical protein